MKNKIYIISLMLIISASFNVAAASKVTKNKMVDVKCHIELVGGDELIYFAKVKQNKINRLVDTLSNRKIPTHLSRDKQQVQRAFECVLLEAKFNSSKANELFEKQPR